MNFLLELESLLQERKKNLPENSYTSTLFKGGIDKILKKIGEEAGEVIIASKNSNKDEFTHEVADLLFHIQVLLVEKDISIHEIIEVLKGRHQK